MFSLEHFHFNLAREIRVKLCSHSPAAAHTRQPKEVRSWMSYTCKTKEAVKVSSIPLISLFYSAIKEYFEAVHFLTADYAE